MKQSIIILTIVLALPACSPAAQTQEKPQQATHDMSQSHMSKSHAEVLEIIEAGNKAKKDMDADALADAARLLTRLGAQPFNTNMQDLAKNWGETAHNLQGTKKDPAFRGRVRGPAYREKTLAPGTEEVLQEIYYASERAELTLKVLDGGALALNVAEQVDNIADNVCTLNALGNAPENAQGNTKNAAASCQWLPLWTAKYNITIVNHGDSPVSYLLVTN